jgi:hypothetical protein
MIAIRHIFPNIPCQMKVTIRARAGREAVDR